MQLVNDFKVFISRGSIVDMATGIIIGASFTAIVKSLVDDIAMPVIGLLTHGIDYSQLFFVLKQGKTPGPYDSVTAAKHAGAITLNFGAFVSAVITFFIVSVVLFLVLRAVAKIYKKPEEKPEVPRQEVLLEEIRDAIRKKR